MPVQLVLGYPNSNFEGRPDLKKKRWVTVIVAAALGGGASFAVGSCGGDDRGGVEVEGSTTGSETSTVQTTTAP